MEHFRDILNQPDLIVTYDFTTEAARIDLNVNMEDSSTEETKMAIEGLRNNKPAGLDEINPELMKAGGQPWSGCAADSPI